jgi:hypothetical protein
MQFLRSAIFDTTCLHSPLKLLIELWQCKMPMGFQNFNFLVIFGQNYNFMLYYGMLTQKSTITHGWLQGMVTHFWCHTLKEILSILTLFNSMFVITLVTILFVTIVASVHSCICDNIRMNPNFSYTCDYNLWLTNLNEKINEKWVYAIHYWLHLLMVDNQVVFCNYICNCT